MYKRKQQDNIDMKTTKTFIKCIECKLRYPIFNYPDKKGRRYCRICKLDGMVDIKYRKCIVCKITRPSYNYPGETISEYCNGCKLDGMVDVLNKKCIVCSNVYSSFNYINEKIPLYCVKCKKHDMVDVRNRMCTTNGCIKVASYGIPCNSVTKCRTHKEGGMIHRPNKTCNVNGCREVSTYGVYTKNPEFCEEHKTEKDICLVERKCKKCGLVDIVFDGLCANICSLIERAIEYKRFRKQKEIHVLSILKENYKEPSENQVKVPYECGGKNSEVKEFGYDYGTHRVYIEVDENQHRSYCALGEINRMKNIYFGDGGISTTNVLTPTIFIRYNPDGYKDQNTKQRMSQNKRETNLIYWIKKYENIKNIPYHLGVHYLHYNDNDVFGETLYEISPYENHYSELKCSQCNKTFHLKQMLDDHQKSHSASTSDKVMNCNNL